MSFCIFLKNFRSYISAHFDFKMGINFICAPNGSGKTNLLEAISLLSPGRGLKKANASEMINTGENFFSISVKFDSIISSYEELPSIDNCNLLSINYFGDNKQFSWNGGKISATELIEEIGVFWLTPEIIFNFWKEPKVRRDFFDRIVGNFIPSHLYNCAKYEKVRLSRNKLIKSGCSNGFAYQAMEKILVEEGIMMIQNRQKITDMLNKQQEEMMWSNDKEMMVSRKSKYRIRCVGFTENTPQEFLKEKWKKDLEENRFGKEKFGPQKTNIVIEEVSILTEGLTLVTDEVEDRYREKDLKTTNKPIINNIISEKNISKIHFDSTEIFLTSELASTGQQHLMVINLVLTAFRNLKQKIKILLLDDILSHLDQKNRMLVMESINSNFLEDYVLITDTQIPAVEFKFNKIYLKDQESGEKY